MKTGIRIRILLTIALLISISISFAQELTILHTNDMHSMLTGNGPEIEYSPSVTNNDNTLGGFSRLATIFTLAKEKNKDATLILDAGDFLMGSLFHIAEEETGFQLNLMKEMCYDVITLGNHEFDFGPETLSNILNAAKEKGGNPKIVASNIVFDKESKEDDGLEKLYRDGDILPYIVMNKNGIKIGVFGLMGINAVDVAPSSKPVSFEKYDKSAEKIVDLLKNKEQVDIVICLSHSGIYHSEDGKSYIGEDIDLAEKVPGINIIISGHTHVKTPKPIKINDTYIVQTGYNVINVGEINLKVTEGKISTFDFRLIPIDDKIEGDKYFQNKIKEQIKFINKKYLSKSELYFEKRVAETEFDLDINFKDLKSSNLGPFVADADKFWLEKNGIDTDFSLVASGTIRESISKGNKGIITVADIFRVMSLGKGLDDVPGYPLAKIYITAKELKKLMEIMVMSRASGGDGYLFTSGLKVYIKPNKMMLRKVQKVELNGKEIDLSKKNTQLYSLAANGYLLSFISRVKEMSHGLVNVIPKDKNGNSVTDMKKQYIDIDPNTDGIQEAKEWIALIEFMKSFEKGKNRLPVIPEKYKKGDESLVEIMKK